MTDTAHTYAASLADKGMPLSHIARATGLSMQDLAYIRPRERQSYTTPQPKVKAEETPPSGSKRAKTVFFESCARLNIDPADVLGDCRKRSIAWARQEIMFDIFVTCPRMSYPSLARMMKRDHTTVLHGVRRHCERIGITYEEAVAMRVVASDGDLSPNIAAAHVNSAVFGAVMKRYADAMSGGKRERMEAAR